LDTHEEIESMIKRLALWMVTTGLLLHAAQAVAQVGCETERREFLAIATALRDDAGTIPRKPSGEPATPEAWSRLCGNIQRGIATYEKGTDYLRRCNGTDKQKTDLSEIIQTMKREFQQRRCEAILRGQPR
jgi:hypothetical protein